MNLSISQHLARIPLSKLNAAIIQCGGQPTTNKAAAISYLDDSILRGQITLTTIEAGVVAVAAPPFAFDASGILRTMDDLHATTAALAATVTRQEAEVDRKIAAVALAAIPKVDAGAVAGEVSRAVSEAFAAFKSVTAPAVVTKVADSILPVREVKFAGDLFPITSYGAVQAGLGGFVDFSNLAVEFWGDADAPAVLDDYVFDPENLHQALVALSNPLPHNCWLAGERGTGKTEFVKQLAARLGRRLFRINFDESAERAEFIGGNTIVNGTVVWTPGAIVKAITHPGAIVLLDEIGFARAQSIATLHALCERTRDRAIVISETGERIPVAPHVAFFVADNSNGHGDNGNFAGVRQQSTAFIDRFSFTLNFEYLPAHEEAALIASRSGMTDTAARMLVDLVNVAREKARMGLLVQAPSLRQLFAWADATQAGLPVATGFKNAVINKFPAETAVELLGIYTATINEAAFKQALEG
jgi:cobaltochelatase CobS